MLSIYTLVQSDDSCSLRLKTSASSSHPCDTKSEQDTLALSLDWNSRKTSYNNPEIAVSTSKGSLSIFTVHEESLQQVWHRSDCHEFEAWIVAFNAWDTNTVFSGGDDGLLKTFDKRVPDTR